MNTLASMVDLFQKIPKEVTGDFQSLKKYKNHIKVEVQGILKDIQTLQSLKDRLKAHLQTFADIDSKIESYTSVHERKYRFQMWNLEVESSGKAIHSTWTLVDETTRFLMEKKQQIQKFILSCKRICGGFDFVKELETVIKQLNTEMKISKSTSNQEVIDQQIKIMEEMRSYLADKQEFQGIRQKLSELFESIRQKIKKEMERQAREESNEDFDIISVISLKDLLVHINSNLLIDKGYTTKTTT